VALSIIVRGLPDIEDSWHGMGASLVAGYMIIRQRHGSDDFSAFRSVSTATGKTNAGRFRWRMKV